MDAGSLFTFQILGGTFESRDGVDLYPFLTLIAFLPARKSGRVALPFSGFPPDRRDLLLLLFAAP